MPDHHSSDQHSKVRFKNKKSKWWRNFPSALQDNNIHIKTKRSRATRRKQIKKILKVSFSILFCLFMIVFVTLKIGISGQFIKDKMQIIVSNKIFTFTDVTISDAKISINNKLNLILEVNNIDLAHEPAGIKLDKIGSLKLGLSTWQLLQGNIKVQEIEFDNANIDVKPSQDGFDFWAMLPKTENGQLDIDQLQMLLFNSSDALLTKFDEQAIEQVSIKDFTFTLPTKTENAQKIIIEKIVGQNDSDSFNLQADIKYGENVTELNTIIKRNNQGKSASVAIAIDNMVTHLGSAKDAPVFFPDGRFNAMLFRLNGMGSLSFYSERMNEITQKPLTKLELALENGKADIAETADLPSNIKIAFEYQGDKQTIKLLPSEIRIGSLYLPLEGVLQTSENIDIPSTNNNLSFSIQSLAGYLEPNVNDKMTMNTHLSGYFDVEAKKLVFSDINIGVPSGILMAKGDMVFGQGTPAINLDLNIEKIDVEDAKKLWPLNIAPGGRRWVIANLISGTIKDASFRVTIPQAFFVDGRPIHPLTVNEVEIKALVENCITNTFSELPQLEEGNGNVHVEGQKTTIQLKSGLSQLANGRQVKVNKGDLVIPWGAQRPVYADLNISLATDIKTAGDVLHLKPVAVADKLPFDPEKAVGNIVADVKVSFPITKDTPRGIITWQSDVNFSNFSLEQPLEGMEVKDSSGIAHVTKEGAVIEGKGLLNGYPATVNVTHPFDNSILKKQEKIVLTLDDKAREKQFSFLNTFLNGPINVNVGENNNNLRHIQVDLSGVSVSFPWVGWVKGKGIKANAQFDIPSNFTKVNNYTIQNFVLDGENFYASGDITIANKQFKSANFKKANLNRGDDIALTIDHDKNTYQIKVDGSAYDARSLIKTIGKSNNNKSTSNTNINLTANLKKVTGFNDETLFKVTASYSGKGQDTDITITAITGANLPMSIATGTKQNVQYVDADSADAGVLLRFVDYYDKLHGGNLMARLSANSKTEPLSGPVKIKNFLIVDEKKLEVLVANTAANRGPNPKDPTIISSRVPFDIAFVRIAKGENYLVVDNGILRGPSVGASFQGVIYDASGNMNLTGTFMPAYGVNTLFSEVPLIGKVLGNGRDRGLIGITFKIEGSAKSPNVIINPVSAIAPGILRQIFEFQ